jgi:hypothetical protein
LIATCETWSSTTTLPALLTLSGLAVASFSPGPLNLSRQVSRKIVCAREPEVAAQQLRAELGLHSYDWVIVGDEALLRALAAGAPGPLEGWFPVDPNRKDIVTFLTSKHEFARRAPEFGIPVPESQFVTSAQEALEVARASGFPLVVKGPYGFSGLEVSIARNEEQLRESCQAMLRSYGVALLQRFIDGESASVAVLYDRGNPLAYKAYVAECPFPREHSAATCHAAFEHPSLEPTVRAVGAATKFTGMAGIDFVREFATGRLYALEINPRPTSAFSGLHRDREFFAPAIVRFLGDQQGQTSVYDAGESAQAYFPGYAFYFFSRANKLDGKAYRRLRASLAEAREADLRIVLWELSRFIARSGYDAVAGRLPKLRSWIDTKRNPHRPAL